MRARGGARGAGDRCFLAPLGPAACLASGCSPLRPGSLCLWPSSQRGAARASGDSAPRGHHSRASGPQGHPRWAPTRAFCSQPPLAFLQSPAFHTLSRFFFPFCESSLAPCGRVCLSGGQGPSPATLPPLPGTRLACSRRSVNSCRLHPHAGGPEPVVGWHWPAWARRGRRGRTCFLGGGLSPQAPPVEGFCLPRDF